MNRRPATHSDAVHALGALANDTRLKVHRLLVQAGENGLSAGFIAGKLGLPASSLSFHLAHLQNAGLVAQRRVGRSLIYSVDFGRMDGLLFYLRENCCRGFASGGCADSAGEGASDGIEAGHDKARRAAGAQARRKLKT
jgi:ArsR family transcriptional regulator, arsenate/arsenite/antimonite-responsive transcriptional repressor